MDPPRQREAGVRGCTEQEEGGAGGVRMQEQMLRERGAPGEGPAHVSAGEMESVPPPMAPSVLRVALLEAQGALVPSSPHQVLTVSARFPL